MGKFVRGLSYGRDRSRAYKDDSGKQSVVKKLEGPSGENPDPLTLTDITVAGTCRGLDLEGVKSMELGMFADFCVEWNKANGIDPEKKETVNKRNAKQEDWNALLG